MAGPNTCPSHLDITFSVGPSLLAIAPRSFDVDPERGDSGVIYCEITFDAPLCKGRVDDVFLTNQFHELAAALTHLMKGKPASVTVAGLESWFRLEGTWKAE